jgi:hypothetical protein
LSGYVFVKRLAPELVRIHHPKHGGSLWSTGKLRGRVKRCEACGVVLDVGTIAYIPITHGNNRSHRLCLPCVDAGKPGRAL